MRVGRTNGILERTKGGLRYSTVLMLRALREDLIMSFTRLYLSTLKLSVGPAESLTMRIDGATSVSVNARRCVTPRAGAMVKKSFSLFLARSFTCTPVNRTYWRKHDAED